jgi:hypothetical protein
MQTREWVRYFEANAGQTLRPAAEDYRLSDDERRQIEALDRRERISLRAVVEAAREGLLGL